MTQHNTFLDEQIKHIERLISNCEEDIKRYNDKILSSQRYVYEMKDTLKLLKSTKL